MYLGHKNPQGRLHLPFWNRPTLTRSAIIISGYVHPFMNSYLMKVHVLHAHNIQKDAVEKEKKSDISGFLHSAAPPQEFQMIFRTVLDLEKFITFHLFAL